MCFLHICIYCQSIYQIFSRIQQPQLATDRWHTLFIFFLYSIVVAALFFPQKFCKFFNRFIFFLSFYLFIFGGLGVVSKARHRGDILEFTIKNNNHLSVSSATFNLYVRGEDWISEHEPNVWTRSSSASGNGNNARSSHTANMHIDDTTVLEPSTASATVHRDDQHNLASLSESFHKLHGSNKNVNNNHHRISISINRFVHRHQQQVSERVSIHSTFRSFIYSFILVLLPMSSIFLFFFIIICPPMSSVWFIVLI